jgi:septum formation protein
LLASNSPRRGELLARAGIVFAVVPPEVVERADPHLTLGELTAWNALRKGLAVARSYPNAVVLAGDTLVALDHEVIGKPRDLAEAERILRKLSGQVHQVCSSVFLVHLARDRSTLLREVTHVRFRQLNRAAIRDYLARIDPLDKAGAYAAQGEGGLIIQSIEGSYTNVVGLPMEQTMPALARFGIRPPVA